MDDRQYAVYNKVVETFGSIEAGNLFADENDTQGVLLWLVEKVTELKLQGKKDEV